VVICTGGMGHFIEIKEHTYQDLTVEFLCTLHGEVRGPQCQAGYVSFYLQGQFYAWNLSTFNTRVGFPPSMDLSNRQVPREFNLNAFWGELSGDFRYSTSFFKCTHITNPYIRVGSAYSCCLFLCLG